MTRDLVAQPAADAFEALIREVAGPGYRLAFAMLHERTAAEDALQEATLKAWRHFGRLDAERPATPWFLAIVANCCRSSWRQRQARDAPRYDARPAASADPTDGVQREDLRRALMKLNPHDRLLVVLTYYLDLPLAQVATIAGMKLPTLKSRLYRAVRTLRPAVDFGEGLR